MATASDNHFTVFIRLPFNRGDFIDPPPVAWSASKERVLWNVISRQGQGKGNEIDWHALATQLEVTQPFILQQAAWLYERQLSQVRAQLRKVGARQSTTPSPAPGSMNSSIVGGQPMKRVPSTGSRVPSRLSTQHVGSPTIGGTEGSTPPTPAKSRTSLPLRSTSGPHPARQDSTSSRPLSRQPSKDDNPAPSQSRRMSTQQQLSRSPGQAKLQGQDSESEDDTSQSKFNPRRPNPSSSHRRAPSLRKDLHVQPSKPLQDDEDDDSPSFLPFAADKPDWNSSRPKPTIPQDPSATLRGIPPNQRPSTHRRTTSERVVMFPTKPNPSSDPTLTTNPTIQQQDTSSSASSLSASQPLPNTTTTTTTPHPSSQRPNPRPSHNTAHLSKPSSTSTATATLSPRQQALLRHRRHGSESSPSMGSSFSDLDDASVTQSALEEALMSNMGNTTNTMASRVSGIGQALRSRYFDASSGGAGGGGKGPGTAGQKGNQGGKEKEKERERERERERDREREGEREREDNGRSERS